jgi:hypothetical protein
MIPARDHLSAWFDQDSASALEAVDNCSVFYAECCKDILLQNLCYVNLFSV